VGDVLLQLTGVTKGFPGVKALDQVDFELKSGEVHTLMGENGAGKSTLIKVLTGVMAPDSGRFELAGQTISPRSPLEAQRLGISTVYQEVNLVNSLSVAENLLLGHESKTFGTINWRRGRERAREALARLGMDVDVRQTLGTFSIAIRQMVAIARALSVTENAKVLILDEPTSSLDAGEVEQLFKVIRKLREDGLGIVFVSHFLDQVYAISDRITVLRNGKQIGTYAAADLPRLELVAKMIGRTASEVEELEKPQTLSGVSEAAPIVKTDGLTRGLAVRDISLELKPGEVLGLAGLLGSGRSETARLIFGLDRRTGGSVEVDGIKRKLKSPREAINLRLGMLAEDRKSEGIFPNLSVRENIAIALQTRRGWVKPISKASQSRLADSFIKSLRIATPDAEKPVGQLSGGNQQKALLGRWLAAEPKVLILDEPTRGIDVGARAEIEAEIARLAGSGMAILLISSELDEVVRTSHRVLVLRDGRPVTEFVAPAATSDTLMEAIARG
jgi:simple sugar transport system ATP-binding protein